MTASFISLLSILIGIIAANCAGKINKKISFGFTGNTILGVFGSVFFIKLLGRTGIDPKIITQTADLNYTLLRFNLLISLLGGLAAIYIAYKLRNNIQK